MRRAAALLALSLFACITTVPYHVAVLSTPSTATLYRSSQPLSQGALAAVGMRPLGLDYRLSLDGEGGVTYDQERAWADALGLQFVPDPTIEYPFPTAKALTVAANKLYVVLSAGFDVDVHCKRGKDRTGGLVAAYEILHTDKPFDDIMADRAQYLSAFDEVIDVEETAALHEIAEKAGRIADSATLVTRPSLYLGVGIDHVPAYPIPSRPADRRLPRPVA